MSASLPAASGETLVASVSLFHLGTLRNDQSMVTYRRGAGSVIEVPLHSLTM